MYKFEPVAKKFYDGLDDGKFFGLKCKDCGKIEFPPYPACNSCGHIGNEWVELSGTEVIINEIYFVSPMMTLTEYMPYAPIFCAECKIDNGPDISCLVFGVTRQNYEEMRDSVPHMGKLVVLPLDGFNIFAVGINGALPIRREVKGSGMNQEELINIMAQKKKQGGGSDKDGVYKFTAKAMGRTQKGKITIVTDGDCFTGILDMMDMTLDIKDGKLSGDDFEFTVEARGTELKLIGTIGNGKISGTAKMGVMKMKLEGERE